MTSAILEVASEGAIVEMKPEAPGTSDLRVPWSRFYWGVLRPQRSGHSVRRMGDTQRWVLEELFQAEVPVAIETLACAFVPLGQGSVVACGMVRTEIESMIAERTEVPGAVLLSFGPDSCPPGLREEIGEFDPRTVNLLVGPYEPSQIRRLRALGRRIPMAAAAAAIALVALGLRIEAGRVRERVGQIQASSVAELAKAGPEFAAEADPERALAKLLARLQRTHGEKAGNVLPLNAGEAMGAVLRAWPRGLETRTTRLNISERTTSLTVDVPDEKSAEALDGALAKIDGWELLPPQAQRTPSGVQVSAMLKPAGGAP